MMHKRRMLFPCQASKAAYVHFITSSPSAMTTLVAQGSPHAQAQNSCLQRLSFALLSRRCGLGKWDGHGYTCTKTPRIDIHRALELTQPFLHSSNSDPRAPRSNLS